MYSYKIKLLIFGLNCMYIVKAIGKEGYCTKYIGVETTNGTDIVEKHYCCRHYESRNNECKECKVGFTSQGGHPCHQCEIGQYGSRCSFTCDCHGNERCNHITGCINFQQKNTEEYPESTVLVKDTRTLTEYIISMPTTHWYPTIKLLTSRGKDQTVSVRRITSTTQKHQTLDLGLQKREIIVYSICASALLIVILLCTACQRHHKQVYGNRRNQTGHRRSTYIPEVPFPDAHLEVVEEIYEVIDESNITDNLENVRHSSSIITDTNEGYLLDNNDYLTPYHTNEGSNVCYSSENISESSANSDFLRPTPTDCQSTSSISNVQGSIFNTADIDTQVHFFSRDSNNTNSSESEAQTRESGYLNPYQPMVSDRDLHEYIFLHDF